MSKEQTASAGIGFGGLLTLVFVAAKLWDRIDWSWWWVCSPLWIPAGIALGIVVLFLVVAGVILGIGAIVEAIRSSRRRSARAKRKAG